MKCDLCGAKMEETFLKKLVGTYIKKGRKKHAVCPACQKSYTLEEIREKL